MNHWIRQAFRSSSTLLATLLLVFVTAQSAFATAMYDASAAASLQVITDNPYVSASTPIVTANTDGDAGPISSDASAQAIAQSGANLNTLQLFAMADASGSTGTTGTFANSLASALASFDLLFTHEGDCETICDDSVFVTLRVTSSAASGSGSVDDPILEFAATEAGAVTRNPSLLSSIVVTGQTGLRSVSYLLSGSFVTFDVQLQLFADQAVTLSVTADASGEASSIPEPATMLLLGSGLLGVAGLRRKLI